MIVKTFDEIKEVIREQVDDLNALVSDGNDDAETIASIANELEGIIGLGFDQAIRDAIQDHAEAEITALATAIAERRTHDAHEILQSLFPEIPLLHPSVTENLFPERIQK